MRTYTLYTLYESSGNFVNKFQKGYKQYKTILFCDRTLISAVWFANTGSRNVTPN